MHDGISLWRAVVPALRCAKDEATRSVVIEDGKHKDGPPAVSVGNDRYTEYQVFVKRNAICSLNQSVFFGLVNDNDLMSTRRRGATATRNPTFISGVSSTI